jgi:hypothetical protein
MDDGQPSRATGEWERRAGNGRKPLPTGALVACFLMIAWAACITVTIGRLVRRPFRPSFIYISVRPFDVSGMGVQCLGLKARVR